MELEDDWDGEGSPGYDETTWRCAVDFLVRNSVRLWDEHGLIVEAPKIRKGSQGSIDIHWRTPTRELLVKVPAAADELADYYGDDGHGGHQVRRTLNPAEESRCLLMLRRSEGFVVW